ncbi:MAG: triose-phosphate isomerase [Clostridiales bacterium]|nr:triose-phosphate isomerase [Clostridiales bacterium]
MRKPIIAGNWKMNKTAKQAVELIEELKPLIAKSKPEVVVCVPYTDLWAVKDAIAGSKIKLGAENVAWADNGAFTGEISAEMLKEIGVEYVIIGHSERRQYFGETDQSVNMRLVQALKNDLKPIVCVGETLQEREKNKTKKVLKKQILEGFKGIEDFTNIVIAYEPVWAIGTGKTATAEDANKTIGYIRSLVRKTWGAEVAKSLRIQYGGSMKPTNAKELMAMRNIDGGLIGGAALKATDFAGIVNYKG